MLWEQITLEAFSAEAVSGWRGGQSFGSPKTYECRVEQRTRRVVGADGHEVLSSGRVVLEGSVPVGVRDRLTLPASYAPRQQPPVLSIQRNPGIFGTDGETVINF
jgi:hypothetical protein